MIIILLWHIIIIDIIISSSSSSMFMYICIYMLMDNNKVEYKYVTRKRPGMCARVPSCIMFRVCSLFQRIEAPSAVSEEFLVSQFR